MRMPDRKVLAGGVAAILAWVMMSIAGSYGYVIPIEMQPFVVMAISSSISYLTPPSVQDIIKRIDGQIVTIIADDPRIPLSLTPGTTALDLTKLMPK